MISDTHPRHVSAVICTRNRHDQIATAVSSILANDYPSFDLTIIDQSTSDATRLELEPMMKDDQRLRYHHSELPGLSRAYNTSVAVTSGELLAFTDDDCVVPNDWIESIAAAFEAESDADLLYGQVLPVERNDDDRKLTPWLPLDRTERIGPDDERFRVIGMGANFAARRRLFDRVGGFDEILGGGGPLRSSQDYDMAYRAFRANRVIILRPEVQIRHDGRREMEEWPALNAAYGIGDGAFYSKHIRCRDPLAAWLFGRHLVVEFGRFGAKSLLGRRPRNWPYLQENARWCASGIQVPGRQDDEALREPLSPRGIRDESHSDPRRRADRPGGRTSTR